MKDDASWEMSRDGTVPVVGFNVELAADPRVHTQTITFSLTPLALSDSGLKSKEWSKFVASMRSASIPSWKKAAVLSALLKILHREHGKRRPARTRRTGFGDSPTP